MAGKGRLSTLVAGAVACCLLGAAGQAYAQVPGLSVPQKQAVTFTFGLGSSTLNEKYGQNPASISKFDKLIQQLTETPSARIDSIVITSYSTTSDQLGSVEIAEQRIDAVKACIEPVIRRSQLKQSVVVTGNVVARNNVFMPDQMFDMLKKATVTVYLNGMLSARSGGGMQASLSSAEEERRYTSPFGNREVFKRADEPARIVAQSEKKSVETVVVPQVMAVEQAAQVVVQEPARVVPLVKLEPAVVEKNNTVNNELQRFIDSLTVNSKGEELPTAPTVSVVPIIPVVTEEEPCPQDQDPEIDALIQRLLSEQSTVPVAPVVKETAIGVVVATGKTAQIEEVGTVTTGRVSDSKRSAVVEYEISGNPELVSDVADAKKIKVKPVKEPKIKPVKKSKPQEVQEIKAVKASKVKPAKKSKVKPLKESKQEVHEVKVVKESKVRPVKVSHEPMTLARPLVAVKTNLAYWAAVAANVEAEFYFAKRWSAAIEGVYTSWNMNLYKKNYAVNEISPEVRYWTSRKTGQYRGLYVGVYGHMGQFDYMFKDQQTGNTGDYYGGGISLGGYLPFTPRFGMELGLRGGFVHADYDRYSYDAPHYMYKSSKTTNYFGLTGVKVSLVYRFGLQGADRK